MKPETWLDIHASHAPERVALCADGRTLTYGELRSEARAVATGLVEAGVGAGDRVAVALSPGCDYALLIHALLLVGATLCPIDARDPADTRGFDRVFTENDEVPRGDPEPFTPGQWLPDSPVCEIRSSGSTGEAKLIPLSAGNIFWSAMGSAHALGVEERDRWLVCLPVFHVSGLMPIYRALIYGTAVTLLAGFSPESVTEELGSGDVTGLSLVPTALADLLQGEPAALRNPRVVLVGGAATPENFVEGAVTSGVRLALTYGMTEASSQVAVLVPDQVAAAPGSVGIPLVTSRVRVMDGEIQVSGPTVSRVAAGDDGWYRTGDLGRLDEQGRLWVEGRKDEMILSGGENVFPVEVESALRLHPGVADALAFPVVDPRWQERVEAVFVPAEGSVVEEAQLISHCREHLPPPKIPKRIHPIAEIPIGATGKPNRRELTERFSSDPR